MKICDALLAVGGLSAPSMMPSYGWSIPAKECKTGSRLRQVKNSVCSKCYALTGRYLFENVDLAMYRRFNILLTVLRDEEQRKQFIDAFVFLLRKRKLEVFRWHDSGDIQSPEHLELIVEIAKQTPDTDHWLPCREYRTLLQYLKAGGAIPSNLNIRVSAHMIDGEIPTWAYDYGMTTSSVTRSDSFDCPAQEINPDTGKPFGNCGSCRKCWDKEVKNVTYLER